MHSVLMTGAQPHSVKRPVSFRKLKPACVFSLADCGDPCPRSFVITSEIPSSPHIPVMLTLAAYRFRRIMADAGGPIARLSAVDTGVLGIRQFQANAFLRSDLIAWKTSNEVFSD